MAPACPRCGKSLEILQNPVRSLRGTGHQWRGLKSLFGEALRSCRGCGAVYTPNGQLLAAALVETNGEIVVRAFRDDMTHLRDAFAAVTIAAELGVAWMWFGPQHFGFLPPFLACAVGILSLFPFVFFAGRVRQANEELLALRTARLLGAPPAGTEQQLAISSAPSD